jgi:hypothetical protein
MEIPDHTASMCPLHTCIDAAVVCVCVCLSVHPVEFLDTLLFVQHMGDFNYPRLADFGAAISGANKFLCQEVLEELDVRLSSVYLFPYYLFCSLMGPFSLSKFTSF